MSLCTVEDGKSGLNWEDKGQLLRGFGEEFDRFLDVWDSHERPAGVHASELTGCLRCAAYTMLGTEKRGTVPKVWRNKFNHGHAIHEWLQARLHDMALKSGGKYKFEDEVRINPENNTLAKDWNIYSSCDGVITFLEDDKPVARLGLEIKTASDAEYAKLTRPKPYHVEQAHVYMACLDLPATWLLYYNKGNENTTPSYGPYLVTFNPLIWTGLVDKMSDLCEALAKNTLPPKDPSIWCDWCKYSWTCEPPWRKQHNQARKKADDDLLSSRFNILWTKKK